MGLFEVFVILIPSIILHELAHGYAANWLGDPTARLAGRLTLNPIPHIDPVGSILVPGLMALSSGGILFGWAKPVPYNPYNLRNRNWGEAFVASAGALTNILLALVFGAVARFGDALALTPEFVQIMVWGVFINVILALFNLIPLPPLDGSKVIMPFLPRMLRYRYQAFATRMEHMGIISLFIVLFVFIVVLKDPFFNTVLHVSNLFLGG